MLWSQSLLLSHSIFPPLDPEVLENNHLESADAAVQSLGGKVWPAQNNCEATGETLE